MGCPFTLCWVVCLLIAWFLSNAVGVLLRVSFSLSSAYFSPSFWSSAFYRLFLVSFQTPAFCRIRFIVYVFVAVFLVVCFWAVLFLAFILSSAFSRLLSVVRLSEICPVPFGNSPSLSNSSPFNQCCVVNFFSNVAVSCYLTFIFITFDVCLCGCPTFSVDVSRDRLYLMTFPTS